MIHVIGNAAVDTVVRLEHLPAPGETVVASNLSEDLGGKGANQAVVIARCGLPVRLVAAVGKDAAGERIRESLAADGVVTDGLSAWDGPTDRCLIYVDDAGENTIVSLIGAARAFDPVAAIATAGWIQAGDWVVTQGNLRPTVLHRCLKLARERAAKTVLNPSPLDDPAGYDWTLVDIAILNRGEMSVLGGASVPAEAAQRLMSQGAGAVVVTVGAEGALLVVPDGSLTATAPPVRSIDSTGAGDVFCGCLVAARAKGLPWQQSMQAASEAGALKVTRPGVRAGFPTRRQLEEIFAAAKLRQGEADRGR